MMSTNPLDNGEKTAYEVVTQLMHGESGFAPVVYDVGQTVELFFKDAESLLERGVVALRKDVVGNPRATTVAAPLSAAGQPSVNTDGQAVVSNDASPPLVALTPSDIVASGQQNDQTVVNAQAGV